MEDKVIRKYVRALDGLLREFGESIDEGFIGRWPSENMVIFLFGNIWRYLNLEDITIRDERKGELDGDAYLCGKRIVIEFEAKSSHFDEHKHDPNKCDLIVCWEDDWKERPSKIDVLELKHFWEKAQKI